MFYSGWNNLFVLEKKNQKAGIRVRIASLVLDLFLPGGQHGSYRVLGKLKLGRVIYLYNYGVLFNGLNNPANSADTGNTITLLKGIEHFFRLFLAFVLGPDNKKIKDQDDETKGHEGCHQLTGTARLGDR
jgi:hypothetical protein